MRTVILLIAFPVLCGLFAACASVRPDAPAASDTWGLPREAFPPDTTLVYRQTPEGPLYADLFFPEGAGLDRATDAARPAVVFFFGGGWRGANREQFWPHARRLARLGVVGMTATYRTEGAHGTTPFDALVDAKAAVRWVREQAARLGVDTTRVAAGGGSAGGHLAAATALVPGYDDPEAESSVGARPDALLLFNPVVDNGPTGYGYDRVGERYAAFSPAHTIGRTGTPPPTLLLLGTEDRLVPVRTAEQFCARVRESGGRCELELYEGAGHGFFNQTNPTDGGARETTTTRAERFLRDIGFLRAPE